MGYSYTHNWKTGRVALCCDYCGKAEGKTRKINICPYNYCPKVALCPDCKKAHPELFTKKTHAECKIMHEEFEAQKKTEDLLLNNGSYIRCSALSINDDTVHVIFHNKENNTIGYYMSKKTYHSIPLLTTAIPDHYRKFGEILEAPGEFYFDKA